MNYYEEKLIKIKELIKNDKKEALSLLNEELKMPYIPEKYEANFIKLANDLEFDLKSDNKKKSIIKRTNYWLFIF